MGLFGKSKKETLAEAAHKEVTLSDGTTYTVAKSVDCLGDSCPRPQLMTKKAAAGAALNDIIEVVIDNPSSMESIPPMCREIACTHLETLKGDRSWQVYIRKD